MSGAADAVASAPAGSDESVRVGLIWAEARGGAIGLDGVMPWHVPEDLAHFKSVTLGGAVIMGRKTWDSIPERFRPFSGRENIVVTRQLGWAAEGAHSAHSLADGIALAARLTPEERVWVIGGAEIFALALSSNGQAHAASAESTDFVVDVLEVTEIDAEFAADTFAPVRGAAWTPETVDPASAWHISRTGLPYRFLRYTRA